MVPDEARQKIFRLIINCELSLWTAPYSPDEAVVPISTVVALIDGLSRYQARKSLRGLVSDGLLEYKSQGRPALVSYGECPELICEAMPPVNGYALTKQAFKTDEWLNAKTEWARGMAEWANGITAREDE